MLTCAATAVRTATKRTAAARITPDMSVRAETVVRSVVPVL
jgi:hypothetical protein